MCCWAVRNYASVYMKILSIGVDHHLFWEFVVFISQLWGLAEKKAQRILTKVFSRREPLSKTKESPWVYVMLSEAFWMFEVKQVNNSLARKWKWIHFPYSCHTTTCKRTHSQGFEGVKRLQYLEKHWKLTAEHFGGCPLQKWLKPVARGSRF
jgi:hypothetical protein